MRRPLFNEKEKEFVLNNIKNRSSIELVSLLKEKMNKEITIEQLAAWKSHHKITNDKPLRPAIFNNEQKQYFLEIVNKRSNNEIANMLNKKFNSSFTIDQIKWYKRHHHLKSYEDHSWNKGKKAYNHAPVGSEFVYYQKSKDKKYSYKNTYIKIAEPNIWERKQHYMYKKYYGEIPKGCAIIFLNGNRDDFSKDNLGCVTMEEHKFMASNEFYFNDIDLTKTGLLITKLKLKSKNSGLNEMKERKVK